MYVMYVVVFLSLIISSKNIFLITVICVIVVQVLKMKKTG